MTEKFRSTIIKFIDSSQSYTPLKPRKLAASIGVSEEDYRDFAEEVSQLVRDGALAELSGGRIDLPAMASNMTGIYRANRRGFGFVIPDEPNSHGDLFIPEGNQLDAISGDHVKAVVARAGKRDGQMRYRGRVVEILKRASGRFVGTLEHDKRTNTWVVAPQGKAMADPIIVGDIPPGVEAGSRVVVELTQYPSWDKPASGVIVEVLKAATETELELLAIIRQYDIPDVFLPEVDKQVHEIIEQYNSLDSGEKGAIPDGRLNLTGKTVITIDPDTARDFDDAISIENVDGNCRLGVHIADVSHFVTAGSPLDVEAAMRGNSTYLPRLVVPMLPEALSNGICSLQQERLRLVKSAFIDYDAEGNVVKTSFANSVISSAKRLTYTQAQGILDGQTGGYDDEIISTLRQMDALAKAILARRRAAGMIHLDLPEKEILFDDDGHPNKVVPTDDSFTHRIIEMFMVEANEAVARLLDGQDISFIRRIHPPKAGGLSNEAAGFIKACGYKIPKDISRGEIQTLVDKVKGRPESYPLNMALLKTFEQAEYSVAPIGHYALASDCYCHFTSPIRRYADLCIHRQLDDYLNGRRDEQAASEYSTVATKCSETERRSSSAEREATTLLKLMILSEHTGEVMDAVVSSVVSSGIFVELLEYQAEGLIALDNISRDGQRWISDPKAGVIISQKSSKRISLGQSLKVKVISVDISSRRLELEINQLLAPLKNADKLKASRTAKKPKSSVKRADRAKSRAKLAAKAKNRGKTGRKKRKR